MKFQAILPFFLCFLLASATIAYASPLDDIMSWALKLFNSITGYATLETTTTVKPSCPYECCFSTDANYEERKCAEPKICKDYKCVDVATTAATTSIENLVKEEVVCVFLNSVSNQKCHTLDGRSACYGTTGCSFYVSGQMGEKLTWTSSCGGYVTTVIDGTKDQLEFICGQATTTASTIPINVNEKVKCVFSNSAETQTCFSVDGKFKCSGAGSCVAEVSGAYGGKLTWKGSCGGEATSLTDGYDEAIEFKCGVTVSTSIPTATPTTIKEPGATTTQPTTTTIQIINEQVKCVFANSDKEQQCTGRSETTGYPVSKYFYCSGVGSCVADVSGSYGAKVVWTSTCAGIGTTAIDGVNKYAEFSCIPATTALTTQPTESQQTSSQPTATVPLIKEQVKCVFANAQNEQKCYANDGKFGCYGLTCIADVVSERGTKLTWKSTCGGYAYTVMDGENEYAEFNCQQTTTTVPSSEPVSAVPAIKEVVKCIFAGSESMQSCGAEGFQCNGVGTCVVELSGPKGKMLTWKSTCGGYAYTVMDGMDEYAEFKCQPASISTPTSTEECADSDGLNYFFKGYAESLGRKMIDTCRVINSNTDYYDLYECSGANCYVLESSCSEAATLQSRVWKCPYDCKDGACVQKEEVKEQIQCRFLNSEVLINPHTATPEKCYTDDGKFSCVWDGGVVTEESGKRYADCVVSVSGYMGAKLIWKSSCGGYAYTVVDGNNEYVEFTCVPSLNVTAQQINGKGFKYAYWQCYDGVEQKVPAPGGAPCQSSESWQRIATDFCKNHCYADGSKCGVNSFSVSGECYIDVAKEGVVFISSQQVAEEERKTLQQSAGTPTVPVTEQNIEIALVCKDSCPSEGKCYPFGYRKSGKFCSDTGTFIDQLGDDSSCENNFECMTNLCVDSKCMSSGLIQKLISWFRRMFG